MGLGGLDDLPIDPVRSQSGSPISSRGPGLSAVTVLSSLVFSLIGALLGLDLTGQRPYSEGAALRSDFDAWP